MLTKFVPPALLVCLFGVAACKKSSDNPPAPPPVKEVSKAAAPTPMTTPADPNAPADVKAAPADAEKTPSGLASKVLQPGSGKDKPSASDTVQVHYRGTLPDGTEFDSSYKRNAPASFPLNRVIKCWTEGVQRMKVGGKAQLTCPPELAYGSRGAGSVIPPNATLLFEIELLAINPR